MIYGKTNSKQAIEYLAWRKKYYNTWYKWFAWYPVKLEDGRKVWWQNVYRKRYKIHFNWRWKYKLTGGF